MQETTSPQTQSKPSRLPRWARWLLRCVAVLFLFVVLGYVGLAWYIHHHREEVLASVTEELNENLTGTLAVGSMETTFLQGFPGISLRLENVVLRDSLYNRHRRTLLQAGKIDVSINALALVRGTVAIKKITIEDAQIDMYTDSLGYSNSRVFRQGRKQDGKGGGSFPELRRLDMNNVTLSIENRQRGKLYEFHVNELQGALDYTSDGWNAYIDLETMVKSMAFSTRKGSFIKNRMVKGGFDIGFIEESGLLTFRRNKLDIGGEKFYIAARIKTSSPNADFAINIENKSILWKNAGTLLSPNITRKLNMFDIKEPIAVKCDLIGGFNIQGDPLIRVNAEVKDNTLDTPGGLVDHCSFFGVFTNEHVKGKGYNDANSAIKLFNFKGHYSGIPLSMNKAFILNLEKPIAKGDFSSKFDMARLAAIVDDDLLKFSKGTADVKLAFSADIVDFRISKPYVKGTIGVKGADVRYVPRKLDFRDVSVALNFTEDDLDISKIVLKSGKSTVNMHGSIKNFLNLYYSDPEKIVLNWQIDSPQLHLGEFMGFLGERKRAAKAGHGQKKGNFTEDLDLLFEKSSVDIKLRVDKLYYNRFAATNAKADVLLTDRGITVKNAGLRHAGGTLAVNGALVQKGKLNNYAFDAVISNVDVSKFFYAFDNFGLESLKSENLKGFFTSKANVSGSFTDSGAMVPKSMYGTVTFGLKKGRLLKFEPIKNVGRIAFPNRDMDNIEFYNLAGKFDIRGEKVKVYPMQVSSSVLNLDMEGVYSFGKGTEMYIDVPLRNPKRDEGIEDKKELAKRRNRGIVLHLKAVDDKDGKVKVKLGGKKD